MEISELKSNPIEQFLQWYQDACVAKEAGCDAMALASATLEAHPSVRFVLYKGISEKGLLFFTNYGSRKAGELLSNPHAAVAIYWPKLERQIRLEGTIEQIPEEESQEYFKTRERNSQLGAWASKQSKTIASRKSLLERFNAFEKQFQNQEIPCPEFWGGFRLIPNRYEFWLWQSHRLSDRFCYQRSSTRDGWEITQLAP